VSLLDAQVELRFGEQPMLQEIRAEKRSAVSGGGVFSHAVRFEEEARANVVRRIVRLAAKEIDQGRDPLRGERGEGFEIEAASP